MTKRYWRGALVFLTLLMLTVALAACSNDDKSDKKDNGSADSSDSGTDKDKGGSTLGNSGGTSGGTGGTSGIDDPGQSQGIGSGKLIADLGFRPEKDGFPFENYGGGPFTNLTATELRRIFGDGVCADLDGNNCVLTPPAKEWMQVMNESMGGGHCYGFSVASLRLYKDEISLSPFGASSLDSLKIDGNKPLQQELAYSFVYQMFDPVRQGIISGTPNDVLDKMIEYLKEGPSAKETYTIGFFKAEGGGGHAVTPFAVEERANGQYGVLIYDNNFPKDTREMLFDRNKNSWSYVASINPNEPASKYVGDASTKSLALYPTNPGTVKQDCPFCLDSGSAAIRGGTVYGSAAVTTDFNEIYLDGNPQDHAHLLITDDRGRRTGWVNGKWINEIPDAQIRNEMFEDNYKDADEPTYRIPVGVKMTITIDGSALKAPDETEVLIIGPGTYIGIEGIKMDKGQKDTLTVSADGLAMAYETTSSESPVIVIGFEAPGADFGFAVQGVDVDGGGAITLTLDKKAQTLKFGTTGNKNGGTYGLAISRTDDDGEQAFGHDGIELDPDDVATLEYGKWQGNNYSVPLQVKSKDGSVEEISLSDN